MTEIPILWTVRQTAEALGLKEGTVYLWIAARKLPVVRLGRSVRIPLAAITELVDENFVPARPEGGRR